MTARYLEHAPHDAPGLRRDPEGRRRCRWCGVSPLPRGRRTFCSDACVTEFTLRRGDFRPVFARDRGVCAACGLDCEALRERYDAMRAAEGWRPAHHPGGTFEGRPLLDFRARRRLWDVDHIREVVRGGGACGLENLQTLCLWCHRDKTARLARERAQERRAQRNESYAPDMSAHNRPDQHQQQSLCFD